MKKPNIVLIHAHDMGRFCQPYGYNIPAPNLQSFAESSVLFRHCHSAAPTCAPARAALWTGQYPNTNGMFGLPSPKLGYKLNDYSQHLSHYFKAQGYATAISGVQHEAVPPFADPDTDLGWEENLTPTPWMRQRFDPGQVAPRAVDYLMSKHEKPFLLSVGFIDPHRNNRGDHRTFIESQVSEQSQDIERRAAYVQPFPHLPDNAITRNEMANYQDGVKSFDDDVGRVLRAIDSERFRDNTIVIVTTDHGPGMSEMKATLSLRGTGVALMVRVPEAIQEGFKAGSVRDGLCQHMDLYPTLCELCGIEKPSWLQGTSLIPLATQNEAIHEEIFTQQTYHFSDEPRPLRCVREGRYVYQRCYKTDQQRGIDGGPLQAWWGEHGYFEQPWPEEALFDTMFDSQEMVNLVNHPDYQDHLARLRQKLADWQSDTADPLQSGKVPVPPIHQQ